jgi:hypothetical protein
VYTQQLNNVPYQGVFSICLYLPSLSNTHKVKPIKLTSIAVKGPYKKYTVVVTTNVVVKDMLLKFTEKLSVKIAKIPKNTKSLKFGILIAIYDVLIKKYKDKIVTE